MSLWSDGHAETIRLDNFRAHDQFLEQRSDFPYRAVAEHLKSRGLWDWVEHLGEDGAFGCVTSEVDGVRVSRDLLDSVLEIAFLRDALGEQWMGGIRAAVDIGAGYGRLVHRLRQLYPTLVVRATDTIPVSVDCCKRYLEFRGIGSQWAMHRNDLPAHPYDLAINVHSWSECELPEIDSWLDWLVACDVRRLFIVPHTPDLGSWVPGGKSGEGPSYRPYLHTHGFQLVQSWHGPEGYVKSYYLFERGGR